MALPALGSIEALEARLGRALEGVELARGQAALDDASALVREEARQDWITTAGTLVAPDSIVTIVLKAAKRAMDNPEGYTSESDGDYTYRRSEDAGLDVYLTEAEKEIVRRYRKASSALWTQETTRGEVYDNTLWVNDQYGTEPFPLYAVDENGNYL